MSVGADRGVPSWLERDARVIAPVYHRYSDLVFSHGRGSYLYTHSGRRVLDFATGIATTVLGHAHPRVVEAAKAQLDRLWHLSVVAHYEPNVLLAEKLREVTPGDLGSTFFANSGAEVVEAAIKLSRIITRRPGLIAFGGAFHGRSMGAVSLTTSKASYRSGYEPLLPSVYIAPYPDPARLPGRPEAKVAAALALDGLHQLLRSQVDPTAVAAMIVEPVLGEGGYVFPHPDFMVGLRRTCDQHGIVLVADEIQSGIGHTGRMFACEHTGVVPDVLLMAKGIANGLPLGALIGAPGLIGQWPSGTHGTTFGGNPVCCAAALATLEVIQEEGLVERAASMGSQALEYLRDQLKSTAVVDVRGQGLMLAVELQDASQQQRVRSVAEEDGLLVIYCGPRENVLRLVPPLNIEQSELDEGLGILARAIATL